MSDTPSIKIVVASHKPYWMPNDPMYIPMQVGAVRQEYIPGFQHDDVGDNISAKNPRYCELTALYWAWKNVDADYIGLAHYRRHFAGSGERGVLTSDEAIELVAHNPVILPKKRHYFIDTVGDHYAHTFDASHIDVLRDSLTRLSPATLPVFEKHMSSRSAHIWNMCIMRKDIFDAWCSWLFKILDDSEHSINFDGMTPFEERAIGRLSERLLDPWLVENDISFAECTVKAAERTNWPKKILSFLRAKFAGKKYDRSF